MDVGDGLGQHAMGAADKSRIGSTEIVPILARKGRQGMLVLWQERPQGERVLGKES